MLVVGDSELVVSFLQHRAVPSRRELVVATRAAHELLRAQCGLHMVYAHVPHDENVWADRLARQSYERKAHVDLVDLLPLEEVGEELSPPVDLHPSGVLGEGELVLAASQEAEPG